MTGCRRDAQGTANAFESADEEEGARVESVDAGGWLAGLVTICQRRRSERLRSMVSAILASKVLTR